MKAASTLALVLLAACARRPPDPDEPSPTPTPGADTRLLLTATDGLVLATDRACIDGRCTSILDIDLDGPDALGAQPLAADGWFLVTRRTVYEGRRDWPREGSTTVGYAVAIGPPPYVACTFSLGGDVCNVEYSNCSWALADMDDTSNTTGSITIRKSVGCLPGMGDDDPCSSQVSSCERITLTESGRCSFDPC